jgi:integration host factor subunit alpha
MSRAESARLVEQVLKEITNCGETVKLASFGSFMVRTRGPRTGRNPKTGVPAPIAPMRVIVFKPSGVLRERLQERNAGADEG